MPYSTHRVILVYRTTHYTDKAFLILPLSKEKIETWRMEYNHPWPHSSLDDLALQEFCRRYKQTGNLEFSGVWFRGEAQADYGGKIIETIGIQEDSMNRVYPNDMQLVAYGACDLA